LEEDRVVIDGEALLFGRMDLETYDAARRENAHCTYLYGLRDPRDGERWVRYIGKSDDPLRRYRRHLYGSRNGWDQTHKARWIRVLLRERVFPELIIFAAVRRDMWQEHERFWVTALRPSLTNSTGGGDGLNEPSAIALANLSRAHLGQKAWNKGLKLGPNPAHAAKLRGRKLTAEHRAAISAASRGREQSPEWVAKRVAATHKTKQQKKRPS
jgi:NUMOD3 motif